MEFHIVVIVIATALFSGGPRLVAANAELEALSKLQSGLIAHQTILASLLPKPDPTVPRGNYAEFYSILRSLSELNEQERRISALLTISEHQSNVELMALQTVFEKLVENACDLMRAKIVGPVNCTYNELMKLKLKLEAYFLSAESISAMISQGLNGQGINRHMWLTESVVCQLTDEGVSLLNRIFANSGGFDKTNC